MEGSWSGSTANGIVTFNARYLLRTLQKVSYIHRHNKAFFFFFFWLYLMENSYLHQIIYKPVTNMHSFLNFYNILDWLDIYNGVGEAYSYLISCMECVADDNNVCFAPSCSRGFAHQTEFAAKSKPIY